MRLSGRPLTTSTTDVASGGSGGGTPRSQCGRTKTTCSSRGIGVLKCGAATDVGANTVDTEPSPVSRRRFRHNSLPWPSSSYGMGEPTGPGPGLVPGGHESTSGRPGPLGPMPQPTGTAPTMLSTLIPIPGSDPSEAASPKAKVPPSAPISQYPRPSPVGTMATMLSTVMLRAGSEP